MAFTGWPVEAIEFYEGLEVDNSKAYWSDHKATFDTKVKAPMEALLAELEPEFGAGRIFRPYRDVRFSKDKTPYKTNLAATVERGGYISLSSAGLGVGSGMWQMSPAQLARFRAAVDGDRTGKELVAIVAALAKKGIEAQPHDSLKRVPPGFDKDHPRADLLKAKGFTCWRQWEPAAWLGTKKAKDRIVAFFHDAAPLNTWLTTQVGPGDV
jgi:uncharacterized protein (TIGR02453 family)